MEQPDHTDKKYSAYFDFLACQVFPEFVELYKETFSLENLKKRVERGESEIPLRYWIKDAAGEDKYVFQNIILTRDEVTKEIIGFAYTRDITDEEELRNRIAQ